MTDTSKPLMSMIKYGSIEYFELLSFNDKLKSRHLDKLDLQNLDRLRFEVQIKIEAINETAKSKRESKEEAGE